MLDSEQQADYNRELQQSVTRYLDDRMRTRLDAFTQYADRVMAQSDAPSYAQEHGVDYERVREQDRQTLTDGVDRAYKEFVDNVTMLLWQGEVDLSPALDTFRTKIGNMVRTVSNRTMGGQPVQAAVLSSLQQAAENIDPDDLIDQAVVPVAQKYGQA